VLRNQRVSASNAVVRGIAAADVEADAAIEPVKRGVIAGHQVVAPRPAVESVMADTSDEQVAATIAPHPVCAMTCEQSIVPRPSEQVIVAVAATQDVVPTVAD
jgi:hypothetical protein